MFGHSIDFWLAKAAFYHRIGKSRMAAHCIRVVLNHPNLSPELRSAGWAAYRRLSA